MYAYITHIGYVSSQINVQLAHPHTHMHAHTIQRCTYTCAYTRTSLSFPLPSMSDDSSAGISWELENCCCGVSMISQAYLWCWSVVPNCSRLPKFLSLWQFLEFWEREGALQGRQQGILSYLGSYAVLVLGWKGMVSHLCYSLALTAFAMTSWHIYIHSGHYHEMAAMGGC